MSTSTDAIRARAEALVREWAYDEDASQQGRVDLDALTDRIEAALREVAIDTENNVVAAVSEWSRGVTEGFHNPLTMPRIPSVVEVAAMVLAVGLGLRAGIADDPGDADRAFERAEAIVEALKVRGGGGR